MENLGTLIICTKDRPAELSRCLSSVVGIDDKPEEILVVDSSSTRASEEVVQKFQLQRILNIRWIPSEPGLTRQRNLGVRLASPEARIVHFVDDDTVIEPGYFARIITTAHENPSAVGFGGRILDLPQPGLLGKLRSALGLSKEGQVTRSGVNVISRAFLDGSTRSVQWLSGCSMSFSRGLFEHESFDERRVGNGYGEDVDFCLRALKHGPLYWNPRATLFHLQSPVNRFDARRLGREIIAHRFLLATDRLHAISKVRVSIRSFLEGLLWISRGCVTLSTRRVALGLGFLEGLFKMALRLRTQGASQT